MPKYKLAEYRYGREEMLALYIKDNKVRSETSRGTRLVPSQRRFKVPLFSSDLCFYF